MMFTSAGTAVLALLGLGSRHVMRESLKHQPLPGATSLSARHSHSIGD